MHLSRIQHYFDYRRRIKRDNLAMIGDEIGHIFHDVGVEANQGYTTVA